MVSGVASVGVRRGAEAEVTCEARGDAPLHLEVAKDGVPAHRLDYR